MCVLACKILPHFKKCLMKKYHFSQWFQEIFNSLKNPFFRNEKKIKTFQRTSIFLRKDEKCSNARLFTILTNIHNTKTICEVQKSCQFQMTLKSQQMVIYIGISLKESSDIQDIFTFVCFHEISDKKCPQLVLKYPYFLHLCINIYHTFIQRENNKHVWKVWAFISWTVTCFNPKGAVYEF